MGAPLRDQGWDFKHGGLGLQALRLGCSSFRVTGFEVSQRSQPAVGLDPN